MEKMEKQRYDAFRAVGEYPREPGWMTFPSSFHPVGYVLDQQEVAYMRLVAGGPSAALIKLHCFRPVPEESLPWDVVHALVAYKEAQADLARLPSTTQEDAGRHDLEGIVLDALERYRGSLRLYHARLLDIALSIVPDAPWSADQGRLVTEREVDRGHAAHQGV